MKKFIIIGLFFVFHICSYSQNLDLIVITSGDSIACKIDSVSDIDITFTITAFGHPTKTVASLEKVIEYKYGVIEKKDYTYKTGTSIITGVNYPVTHKSYLSENLEKASQEELNFYLKKALKQKKTGVILTIAGPVIAIAGVALAYAGQTETVYNLVESGNTNVEESGNSTIGAVISLAGTATTLIGLPLLIVNSSRVKKIKNTLSDRVFLEIAPCSFHNYMTQNYQHGATLKIKF